MSNYIIQHVNYRERLKKEPTEKINILWFRDRLLKQMVNEIEKGLKRTICFMMRLLMMKVAAIK
jgi:hypothetical protein